ncbi:MAG: hypothetical protein Q9162_002253 [Coniocarpon cinnabarinum]
MFQSQEPSQDVVHDLKETDIVPRHDTDILEPHRLGNPSQKSSSSTGTISSLQQAHKAPGSITGPASTMPRPNTIPNPYYECRNLQAIAGLCATLKEVAEGRGWLGCLRSNGKCQRFDLLAVRCYPQTPGSKHVISLHDILAKNDNADRSDDAKLNWFDRRFLALCLASTMLQLYNTPWLQSNWSGSDVSFVRLTNDDGKPLIRKPFLSQSFASQRRLGRPSNTKTPIVCPLIRNKAVFDLGVILIELCFRKPIRCFQTVEDLDPNGNRTILTDFLTASKMIDRVKGKAGAFWADAVRRCIYCEFDQHDTSLENEDFRQAVYQGVVKPLQEDFKQFCGGKLPDDI